MSDQLSLLDPVPAPEVPSRSRKQAALVLDHVRRLEGQYDGVTAWQIYLGWKGDTPHAPQQNVIMRRLTDLREAGLVREDGERLGGYGLMVKVFRSVG